MSDAIMLDTSILIDFFRKENKENAILFSLSAKYKHFYVSVITEYEIFSGSTPTQQNFWETFFSKMNILTLDSNCTQQAVSIHKVLKRKNKMIEIPDLLIAATALTHQLPIATINKKHFERVEGLLII